MRLLVTRLAIFATLAVACGGRAEPTPAANGDAGATMSTQTEMPTGSGYETAAQACVEAIGQCVAIPPPGCMAVGPMTCGPDAGVCCAE